MPQTQGNEPRAPVFESHMTFKDRRDAGRQLARYCQHYAGANPLIIGLPRGGVIVAAEIANALNAPLDIIVVRKIGSPFQAELAIGAVYEAGGPQVLLDERLVQRLGVAEQYIQYQVQEQIREIRRRQHAYRGSEKPIPIRGRITIVVDDGVATGASTRAALRAVRAQEPGLLVLAIPVAAPDSLNMLKSEADEVICLLAPEHFRAVGEFYQDFDQTTDDEVIELLAQARSTQGRSDHPSSGPTSQGNPS
jgi:putative phosphoribosyl transferase